MRKSLCKLLVCTVLTSMISNTVVIKNVYADDKVNSTESESKDWNLVWEDDFDGNSLNLENWNYETHEPGWVNNELQAYTDSTENIFVKDGELVLKAIEEKTENGNLYTSGKITTQNKHDYKYGRFEARIKVPAGQGLWPAFWMMPTNESLYGSWPKCGEIDIMEVLGNEPEKAYGTIHYGNPHREQQGTYVLDGETFADDYHVFAVEWEPSEMRFYIDGNLYHTVNDWYTKQEGDEEKTYPAPFDQPFYLQFNLAVGGNWPGNPDETTDFENAELKVDYVKVYQLDSYDENVTKPEKEPVDLRDPDANGNYINNGDFSVNEDLTDSENWIKLSTLGGSGQATIKDNKIILTTDSVGTENYSLQLVQPSLPLKQYGEYRISFDAKADADRTMIVNITSPDRGYVRQFPDTIVNLSNELKTYTYDFTMKDIDEKNGRLEFNYGNQGSLANIEISNVKLEKTGQGEAPKDDKKTVLSDGNYVYNGTFDVGQNRMKYWDVETKVNDANVLVTNTNNLRELKVDVKEQPSQLSDVIVKQTELAISKNKEYTLSFDAYAEEDKTIKAEINGESFEANINKDKKNFKYKFKTGDVLNNSDLQLLLGAQGVTYIDNVRIEETGLISNGDFSSGFSTWELFTDSSVSSKVTSSIDSSTGDSCAKINIKDTGDADWKIQLKQNKVKLEKGKKYTLSLDAKSSIDRPIMFTIQRDGSTDNNWIPYSKNQIVDLTSEYKTYKVIFEMSEESDENSIFSIAMGAVSGKQITDEHSISIDNVKLEEYKEEDTALITNGDFNNGFSTWELFVDSGIASKVTSAIDDSTGDNCAKINIKDTGDADWKIQLKQNKVKLEKGKKYTLSLDAKSSIDRPIMFTIQRDGSTDNNWIPYSKNQIVDLTSEYKTYKVIFEMDEESDENSIFSIAMGAVKDKQITEEHSISIDNVKLEEYKEEDVKLVTEGLLNAIEKAKEIVNSDTFNTIVEEDRTKLVNELKKAEEIYNDAIIENSSVKQEDIDNAEKDLIKVIESLRKNDDKDEVVTNPDDDKDNTVTVKPNDGNNSSNTGENSNKNENSSLVQTGDMSSIVLVTAAILMCLVGVSFIKKRKLDEIK